MEQILKSSVVMSVYGERGLGHRYDELIVLCCEEKLIIIIRAPEADILGELSDSRWGVYDVLPTFFTHEDIWVALGKPYHIITLLSLYLHFT